MIARASLSRFEPSPLHFRWLGVAGLELTCASETLLIDPFFTRPPLRRLWFGRLEPDHALIASRLPPCEHILVSHSHYDHLMDVPDAARYTGAHVYGSTNTCELLRVCGLPEAQIHLIHAGDELALGCFKVKVLAARHGWAPGYASGRVRQGLQPPLRLRDYVLGDYHSFLIQLPGLRILNWCGIDLQAAPRADILFTLPTSRPGFLEALLDAVQPRLVVPVHWDDLFRPLTRPLRPYYELPRWQLPPLQRINLRRFRDRIEHMNPSIQVLIPEIFKAYDLSTPQLAVQ